MKISPAFQNKKQKRNKNNNKKKTTISAVETMEAMKDLRCTRSGVSHC